MPPLLLKTLQAASTPFLDTGPHLLSPSLDPRTCLRSPDAKPHLPSLSRPSTPSLLPLSTLNPTFALATLSFTAVPVLPLSTLDPTFAPSLDPLPHLCSYTEP
eukprot:3185187-Rhodomonas_salina.1